MNDKTRAVLKVVDRITEEVYQRYALENDIDFELETYQLLAFGYCDIKFEYIDGKLGFYFDIIYKNKQKIRIYFDAITQNLLAKSELNKFHFFSIKMDSIQNLTDLLRLLQSYKIADLDYSALKETINTIIINKQIKDFILNLVLMRLLNGRLEEDIVEAIKFIDTIYNNYGDFKINEGNQRRLSI